MQKLWQSILKKILDLELDWINAHLLYSRKWMQDSYEFWDSLRKTSEGTEAGVLEISGYMFSSQFPEIVRVNSLVHLTRNNLVHLLGFLSSEQVSGTSLSGVSVGHSSWTRTVSRKLEVWFIFHHSPHTVQLLHPLGHAEIPEPRRAANSTDSHLFRTCGNAIRRSCKLYRTRSENFVQRPPLGAYKRTGVQGKQRHFVTLMLQSFM